MSVVQFAHAAARGKVRSFLLVLNMGQNEVQGKNNCVSYIILNGNGGLMRVAWLNDDGCLHEESRWDTRAEAEQAVLLLTEYPVGGELNEIHGLQIVKTGDA